MGLIDLHVNERHIADESHVGAFEVSTENTVVEAWHEKQSGRARLGHAHEAHERAEKTVEEEVKVI